MQIDILPNNVYTVELAERTGIAQTEISKLENGTRNPSIYGKTLIGKWVSTVIGLPVLAVLIAWVAATILNTNA